MWTRYSLYSQSGLDPKIDATDHPMLSGVWTPDTHFNGVTDRLLWICTVVNDRLQVSSSWVTPEKPVNHTAGPALFAHQKHRKIKSALSGNPSFRFSTLSLPHSASFHQSRKREREKVGG